MEIKNFDPNAPAFGSGAQRLEDATTEPSVEEGTVASEPEKEPAPSVEETKVPYSRFKNIHEAKKAAEAEAEYWRSRAVELEQSPRDIYEPNDEMPSYWRELYGDSDASQKAWKIQQRRDSELEQRAYEAAQRATEEREYVRQEQLGNNLNSIDDRLEELEDFIGRPLTEKEESAILDIVDDYTPKDAYGNYQGELIPFDKAWETYELRNLSSRSQSRQSRDTVAGMTATQSQGDTDNRVEQDKNWNPLARGSWRKRL